MGFINTNRIFKNFNILMINYLQEFNRNFELILKNNLWKWITFVLLSRRVGRVVDCGSLENC